MQRVADQDGERVAVEVGDSRARRGCAGASPRRPRLLRRPRRRRRPSRGQRSVAASRRGVAGRASSASSCSRVRRRRSSAARWRAHRFAATSSPPRSQALRARRRSAGGRRRSPTGSRAARRRGGSAGSRGGSSRARRCAGRRRGRAPAAARARRARRPRRARSRGSGSTSAGPRRPRRAGRCARAAASAGPRPRSAAGSRLPGRRRSPAGRPRASNPTMRAMDVVVVGAGISGLAAAYELQRRGARVTRARGRRASARASRSAWRGSSASPTPTRACARWRWRRASGWRAWERDLRRWAGCWARRALVGRAASDDGRRRGRGDARGAGAPRRARCRAADIEARIPLLPSDYAWGGGIWDPLAGSLRIRRTLAGARGAASTSGARPSPTSTRSRPTRSSSVPASARTTLVPALDFEMTTSRTCASPTRAGATAPCVISPELYGCAVGSTGRYAIGMHDQTRARRRCRRLRRLDRVECVSLLRRRGSTRTATASSRCAQGRVTAFTGTNLMKFGPLLGDRLAHSVLDGRVHPTSARADQHHARDREHDADVLDRR